MKREIIQLLTAFLSSFGFSLLFGLRKRYLITASLGGLLATGVYLLAQFWTGNLFVSNLLAAAASVLYAELLAHLLKCPATLFVTPAILPLVPGGSLYYTMSHAVQGDMTRAKQFGMNTLQAALAIAVGISIVLAARQLHSRKQ